MSLSKIRYTGTKEYRDRTPLRRDWLPGDVKPVPERDACKLLLFVEFERADDDESVELPDANLAAEEELAAQAEVEESARIESESMLMLLDTMDKDALEAYAMKYEVDLDKRRSVEKLRAEVTSLIEQFGAR